MTWAVLLAVALSAAAQTPPAPGQSPRGQDSPGLVAKQLPNHTGGLVTYYSGNRLKDEQSQVAINVFFDRDSAVTKRSGQVLFQNIEGCSAQVRSAGVYNSPTGTEYLFEACGGNAYVSSGGPFSVIGGTISATSNVYFQAGLGLEWVTDGIDPLWSTDGVVVSSYPTAPLAQLIGIFQNRVLLANVSGGKSTVYLSGYNNGGDYTLPAVIVDTSAAIFGLNGLNDGRAVTCVSSAYRDVQILWNGSEMYGLYGSGNSTFILRKLAEIGCDEQETVQEFDGKLRWLSSFGVYQYDGANTQRISDEIKDQILNIIATESGSLSLIQDTQADWQGGNLKVSGPGAPMSATIVPGSVVPSTWGYTFNSAATWATGTRTGGVIIQGNTLIVSTFTGVDTTQADFQASVTNSNMDFTTMPDAAIIASTNSVNNYGFENGLVQWNPTGTAAVTQDGSCGSNPINPATQPHVAQICDIATVSPNKPRCSMGNQSSATISVYKGASLISQSNPNVNPCGAVTFSAATIAGAAAVGDTLTIKVASENGTESIQSDGFTWLGNDITMLTRIESTHELHIFYPTSTGFKQSGSYTSRTFDTQVSSPSWGYFQSVFTGTVAYQLESSVDGTNWSSPVVASTGSAIIGLPNREYVRYLASLSHVSGDTTPVINSVEIDAASTGTFTSTVFDTGFSTPTWGALAISSSAGSSSDLTFNVSVATSATGPFDAAIAASAGVPLTNAQKEFIEISVPFTVAYATAPPVLNSLGLDAATTGYFITACFNTSPIVAWGTFQSNSLPGNGALAYSVSTGTSCGDVESPTANWTAQAVNSNVSVSTASFLGVRVLFTFPSFDPLNLPTLEDITVNWTSTAGRPRSASQVFDNRYWLAYTTATSGTAFNNSVLVYDSEGHWSKLQGINASSFATYNRELYSGSSLGDGNVNVQNTGSTDFGGPILFDFRTPDYELDAFNIVDLYDLNLEFASVLPQYNPSLSVQYYADHGTTAYSLGTVPLTVGRVGLRFSNQRIGANASPTKVNTFGFEIMDNSTTPLTFYRSMIRFIPEDGP